MLPACSSIDPAVRAIQIEPGRLQFIESHFATFLQGPDRADLLSTIHESLFVQGKSIGTVFREIGSRFRGARVIAITSGKGGVGKTTVSVNLAVALALAHGRVLLFDADLGMANAHVFAGVNPPANLLDVVQNRAELAQIVTRGPAGVDFICGASGVAHLASLSANAVDRLCRSLAALASGYDFLLIDTGAGISASVLRFLEMATEVVVVTTPNLAAVLDAYGLIKAAHEAQLSARLHLLVNQAEDGANAETAFARVCGCAERFLHFAPEQLGFLVRDPAFEASNQGRQPLVLRSPEDPSARRLKEFASRLAALPSERLGPAPSSSPIAGQTIAA